MHPFRRLKVWAKAHELTVIVYRATANTPRDRGFGLVSQLRRAVATIPANIAEGAGHSTDPQFNRFLEIALASANEADYHLLLAKELEVLTSREHAKLEARLVEVRQMLVGLRRTVLERIRTESTPTAKRQRNTMGRATNGS